MKTKYLIPFLFIYISFAVIYGYVMTRLDCKILSNPGQFGDSFGAYNAFFSGLAFCAIAITTWMQAKQLATQEADQRATKNLLKTQTEATIFAARLQALPLLINQADTSLQQKFGSYYSHLKVNMLSDEELLKITLQKPIQHCHPDQQESLRLHLKVLLKYRSDAASIYNELMLKSPVLGDNYEPKPVVSNS